MVTMQDVATRANVSIATVSFTLNNSKPVSAETRERVERAMRELGYRRNAVGRALARRQTQILALLYPAMQHRLDRTVTEFFTAAAAAATERGYHLVLWPMSNDAEQIADLTSAGLVDGALLMEVQLDDPRVDALAAAGLPFAMIGRTREPAGLTYVDIDFESTVADAVARIAGEGHERVLLVDGSRDEALPGYGPVARTRETFARAVAEHGLAGRAVGIAQTAPAGRALARELAADPGRPTAALVMNELGVVGLVGGLEAAGVAVPAAMSVVSISTSGDMADLAHPELSAYVSPAAGLGRRGVLALIALLDPGAEPPAPALLACTYRGGGTLAPASR